MPPTTHKEIREIAYKKLEDLQEKLDKLVDAPKINRSEIRAASVQLLEARAQLQLTVSA